jgi:hypothetical protein
MGSSKYESSQDPTMEAPDNIFSRTASSGKNMKNILHVTIGSGSCLLWIATSLMRGRSARDDSIAFMQVK